MSKTASPKTGSTPATPASQAVPSAVDEAKAMRAKLARSAVLRIAGVVVIPLVVQPWTPSTSPEQRASVVAFVGLVTASLFFILPQLAAVTAFLRAQAARAAAPAETTKPARAKAGEDYFDRQARTAKWQLGLVLTLAWLWIGWLASESVLSGVAVAVSLLPVALVFASSMYRTAFVEWRTAVARDFLNSKDALLALDDDDELDEEEADWSAGDTLIAARPQLAGSA